MTSLLAIISDPLGRNARYSGQYERWAVASRDWQRPYKARYAPGRDQAGKSEGASDEADMLSQVTADTLDNILGEIARCATNGTLRKLVLCGPEKSCEIRRVDIRPVEIRGQRMLQIASRTQTQEFHRNIPPEELVAACRKLLESSFRQMNLQATYETSEARLGADGRWSIRRQAVATADATDAAAAETHNRIRQHIIPEGQPCAFLAESGVMTADGRVRAVHSRKFRQINRYLEFIRDLTDSLPHDREVRIVDFGCGKSYLTFAVHHLFEKVLRRPCTITGLDVRDDVIAGCNAVRDRLNLQNLDFRTGTIAGFRAEATPDLVISLHACDTATDDALAQAVQWGSPAVLAVPCCHKEMNRYLTAASLTPVTSYGLARERFSAMTTDCLRASLMSAVGYSSQLLEFIEMEHTPKNILLRSVRRTTSNATSTRKALNEVRSLSSLLGIPELRLETLLRSQGQLPERPTSESGQPLVNRNSGADGCGH